MYHRMMEDCTRRLVLMRRRSRFSATPCSSLPSREGLKMHLLVMRMAKSRRLTGENGCKISLTTEDLRNACFAVFCRSSNLTVKFFGRKSAPIKGETVFQVSCLNSQSCKNNQPNLFQGPLFGAQMCHVILTGQFNTSTIFTSRCWGSV